ncbi:MAG: GMC family oxidoreductase N-terminal domain-containing protein [Lacisediminihabitans sp.]
MSTSFDAIVIGAGSAGSVITRRLIDAGMSVLLLEAGGPDTNPAIHDPMRMGELWHSQDDWDYHTVPQEHAAGRRLHLPRGKVLGGSHSLNAMIWVRCAPEDFDRWERLGNPGWGWQDVLPVYREIENYDGGASELRGVDGLLDVIADYELHPIQQAIIEAGTQLGLEHNPDYNSDHLDGISQQQLTVRDGKRLNTWLAYVAPIVGSTKLTVKTGCWVHRLLLDGDRAVGVEYEQDGSLHRAMAGEIVLSAGAIDSPRVLLRSGIGPADELRELGIEVAHDSAGVGRNLHDHLLSPVIFTTEKPITPPRPGMSVSQTHLFWRSSPDLLVPDTQPINFSVPMYQEGMEGPSEGFTLMAGMISPESRGSIRLSGDDPHAALLIDLNALAEKNDLLSLEASVRQCRQLGLAPALEEAWGAHELYPGPKINSDAALRDYVRRTAITYHHQVGTCKMGTDSLAVVDPKLAVHGIRGLRIADASIMPVITSGNTNAPTIMIAEKAARFILD